MTINSPGGLNDLLQSWGINPALQSTTPSSDATSAVAGSVQAAPVPTLASTSTPPTNTTGQSLDAVFSLQIRIQLGSSDATGQVGQTGHHHHHGFRAKLDSAAEQLAKKNGLTADQTQQLKDLAKEFGKSLEDAFKQFREAGGNGTSAADAQKTLLDSIKSAIDTFLTKVSEVLAPNSTTSTAPTAPADSTTTSPAATAPAATDATAAAATTPATTTSATTTPAVTAAAASSATVPASSDTTTDPLSALRDILNKLLDNITKHIAQTGTLNPSNQQTGSKDNDGDNDGGKDDGSNAGNNFSFVLNAQLVLRYSGYWAAQQPGTTVSAAA